MFRRKSSSRHQPLNPIPSASAQSAASHAFLAHLNAPNNNLSSAAAAAALRSHTPTPTRVENVQTKRMLQRQLSVSSRISAPAGSRDRPKPSLHRSNSSGSMTSRTFRDQPPRRPMSSSGALSAPPVPPLPDLPSHSGHTSPERQPSSLDSAGRAISPPIPRRVPGHSVGSGDGVNLGGGPEFGRPESRTSINFSYPMNSQPNSPRMSPVPPDPSHSNTGQPLTGELPPAEIADMKHCVWDAASHSVKRSKIVGPGALEESHLALGTVSGPPTRTTFRAWCKETSRPHSSDISETGTVASPEPESSATQKPESVEDPSDLIDYHGQGMASMRPTMGHSHSRQSYPQSRTQKRSPILVEDRRGEGRAEMSLMLAEDTARGIGEGEISAIRFSEKVKRLGDISRHELRPGQALSMLKAGNERPKRLPPDSSDSQMSVQFGDERPALSRPHSISPNRSARFSSQLAVASGGEPLHNPPPRSVSPAKPALKHSSLHSVSSDRRVGTAFGPAGQAPSEVSDATSAASDEGSRSECRTRVPKVSFDDEAEVVGIVSSPPTSPDSVSPLTPPDKIRSKPNWFGLGKKFVTKDIHSDDDFDEVLKPRPALPSFGSIRGGREVVDVELASDMISDNESIISISNSATVGPASLSDHANNYAALMLPQTDLGTLDTALAPQATLEEGDCRLPRSLDAPRINGKRVSPIEDDREQVSTTRSDNAPIRTRSASASDIIKPRKTVAESRREPIPVISVQPASPSAEGGRTSIKFDKMPGGFPLPSDERHTQFTGVTNDSETPSAVLQPSGVSVTMISETSQVPTIAAGDGGDSDAESGDSVYSDAAESLADFEGDGFGSINAIVDSPISVTGSFTMKASDAAPSRLASQKVAVNGLTYPKPSSLLPIGLQVSAPTITKEGSSPSQEPLNMQQGSVMQQNADHKDHTPGPAAFDTSYPPWPIRSNIAAEPASRAVSAFTSNSQKKRKPVSPSSSGGLHSSALRDLNGQDIYPVRVHSFSPSQISGPPTNGRDHRKMPSKLSASFVRRRHKENTEQPPPDKMTVPLERTICPNRLSRTMSNDSDSSSSFKRSRRSPKPHGQINMKQTLRKTARLPRTQSPERPISVSGSRHLTTLRGPRIPGPQHETSVISSLTKHPKSSSPKGSSFKSRFNTSDDEVDSEHPRHFRSRFEGSSDDEPSATPLRPVRGIPRRQGIRDGDSTDLEDSSDEEEMPRSLAPVTASSDAHTVILPLSGNRISRAELEELLSYPRKTSLLHRLTPKRIRRKDGKVLKSELDSAARRDTPLERSPIKLKQIKEERLLNGYGGYTVTTITADPPRSSTLKLQKKSIKGKLQENKAEENESWPLPSHLSLKGLDPGIVEKESQTGAERPTTPNSILKDTKAEVSTISKAEMANNNSWSTRLRLTPNFHSRESPSRTSGPRIVGNKASGKKKPLSLFKTVFRLRL